MRPTDDPMNVGVSAPVVDERTLRKRKRDLAAAQNDGTYLDHPGGAQNPAVDLSHNFQAASYNADANKRVKFGGRASQSVIRSDQSGRVPLDRSELPGELWQHVFKFLPPHTLGRLLRVRKSFNRLLTPDQAELPADHTTLCALKYVHPNTIWAASRKIFYPGMPRPLAHLNELQMWNLVVGTACQFCNKRASSLIPDAAPWEAGPGRDGVRVVWPFGVRACGECLEARCEKVRKPRQPCLSCRDVTNLLPGNGSSIVINCSVCSYACHSLCILYSVDALRLFFISSWTPTTTWADHHQAFPERPY